MGGFPSDPARTVAHVVSTLLLLLLAWAVTVPAVLGLGRLLGRLSTPRVEGEAPAVEVELRPDNVVALVPRPQNRLDRRAA
jgi:hypothetical protein